MGEIVPTSDEEWTRLTVRVPTRVANLLTERVASERRLGHKVTKSQLVTQAIIAWCGNHSHDTDDCYTLLHDLHAQSAVGDRPARPA